MTSPIGKTVEFELGGVMRRGECVAYQPAGDQTVFWARLGDDGQIHRFVAGPRRVVDPLTLAALILARQSVHTLSVGEQLNALAAAVVEANGREKAA